MQAICLKCKKNLPVLSISESGQYLCECGSKIPYHKGIYQFVTTDDFYEGKFTKTRKNTSSFEKLIFFLLRLFSIDGNEERMWRKSTKYIKGHSVSDSLQILNIGSGGGHSFLNNLGSVTAVDLSLKSLMNSQDIYDYCYQADACNLPFPDECFDLVFSSHLLGHIPLKIKQDVIKEIYRVTKPGGFSLHSVECEANNFVYNTAKKHPELYEKHFRDMYGHYGLEYPSFCKMRFRKESFVPIFEFSDFCKGLIRPANSYKIFFASLEFREKNILFNLLYNISSILSFTIAMRFVSGFFLYPLTLFNRLGGEDSVDSIKLLYQKNIDHNSKLEI